MYQPKVYDPTYEALLQKASDMNLEWDDSYYDPIGLLQLVDEAVFYENKAKRQETIDYRNRICIDE